MSKKNKKIKLHIPFSVELIPPKRVKFKGFEDVALLKLQIKKAVRNLYQNNTSFRYLAKEAMRDDGPESVNLRADFVGVILQTLIELGGAVPPYFMPVFLQHKYELKPDGNYISTLWFTVFRPDKEVADGGSNYYFGNDVKHENVDKQIWFTGHTLDRIEERLKLTKKDVGFWLSIFNWSTWTIEPIGEGLVLRAVHKIVKKPIPFYFPFEIVDTKLFTHPTKLLTKTLLLPGMTGIPEIPDWEESLAYLRKFWQDSLAISGVNLDKLAGPDLTPVKPICLEPIKDKV